MNIAIVEQSKPYRESLKILLNQIPDFRVVLDTDNHSDFLKFLITGQIDILFLDFEYIETGNTEIMLNYSKSFPTSKIIVLSSSLEICRYETILQTYQLDVMLKNSKKQDFENHIIEAVNKRLSI
jgi:DNA-binding NarL/FixJ family response regulator